MVDGQYQMVGIITQNDLFRALMALTGLARIGIQFAFQVEDRPGSIKEVADIIRKYGGRMVSILSAYKGVDKGYRRVYFRMFGIDRKKLSELKDELRAKATLLYMVDHRQDKREIYAA